MDFINEQVWYVIIGLIGFNLIKSACKTFITNAFKEKVKLSIYKLFRKEYSIKETETSEAKQDGITKSNYKNVELSKEIQEIIRNAINTSDYKYRLEHELREKKNKSY